MKMSSYADTKRALAISVKRGDWIAVRDGQIVGTAGTAMGATWQRVTMAINRANGMREFKTGVQGGFYTVPNGTLILVRKSA